MNWTCGGRRLCFMRLGERRRQPRCSNRCSAWLAGVGLHGAVGDGDEKHYWCMFLLLSVTDVRKARALAK